MVWMHDVASFAVGFPSMSDTTYILGLSAYYHDSAAALLAAGEIVAAAPE